MSGEPYSLNSTYTLVRFLQLSKCWICVSFAVGYMLVDIVILTYCRMFHFVADDRNISNLLTVSSCTLISLYCIILVLLPIKYSFTKDKKETFSL